MSQRIYTESKWIFKWYSMEPCPKTRFCGQRRVQVAVGEAVWQFNAGSVSVIEILSSLCAELSRNAYRSLGQKDKKWLHEAARKTSLKAQSIRRKNRAKKKAANESVKYVYLAGGFGIKKTPDLYFVVASKIWIRVRKDIKQQKTDGKISIKFFDEKNIVHIVVT